MTPDEHRVAAEVTPLLRNLAGKLEGCSPRIASILLVELSLVTIGLSEEVMSLPERFVKAFDEGEDDDVDSLLLGPPLALPRRPG